MSGQLLQLRGPGGAVRGCMLRKWANMFLGRPQERRMLSYDSDVHGSGTGQRGYGDSFLPACTTALRDCSENYDACVEGLEGGNGGYGVTIQVPGAGGTTVAQAQTTLPSATATSVCSTLSLQACHGLSNGLCRAGTQGVFTVGSENGAPRPTAACMAGVMAGVGFGIMGGRL
ncbi:hypothetical protein E0Z10_g1891 [Xylaria hypoxylon]|uniref:Uncharacterized protein n=1 Tax=Xylaria hypoxylon TaxID=37992 RepID=A0A4Z0YS73_9PEZI|nr:hypothetical protein E0Z10_g1891 [Xylaria hypoxylon]